MGEAAGWHRSLASTPETGAGSGPELTAISRNTRPRGPERHADRATDEERVTAASDCTLYERWLESRDGDAFAALAQRHGRVVYDLAVRYSGDAVLAEDLVQEALLDLALAGSRKPIEVGIVAWMARFAMCRARNLRASERSRSKRQRTVGERRREDVMPDDHLEREEELERVLARAEPGERVVLAMRYLHGWDYGRIASALSVSEGAARVRVHRALTALRQRLGVGAAALTAANGGDAGKNGKNGQAALGTPVLALLGGLAVHRMPDGLLAMGVQNAIGAAGTVAGTAAGGGGAGFCPRVGRLTLQALGLTALLGAATAVSLTAPPDAALAPASSPARSVAAVGPGAGVTARGALAPAAAPRRTGVPRPPSWDDDVLSRVGPTRDASAGAEVVEAAGRAPPTAPGLPFAADRPVEVLRPKSRDARAATRDPVSSEDERAGTPAGHGTVRVAGLRAAPADAPALAVAAAAEPSSGLSRDVAGSEPMRHRRTDHIADRPTVLLDDLPPEQAELVSEAAALVARIVAEGGDELGGDPTDRRVLRRQSKALRKQYRRARRGLRRAAAADDEQAFAEEVARAAKVSTAQYVLKLLLGVVYADGRTAAELTWPEGADVTEALQDVVDTLGTLLPDGAVEGEGAIDERGDESGGEAPSMSPDGAAVLPDGAER